MKQSWRSYVYFSLSSYEDIFDWQHITETLGVKPTEVEKKWEIHAEIKRPNKFNQRKLSTEPWKEYQDMSLIIEKLIDQFSSKTQEINNIKQKYNLYSKLQIVLYIDKNELTSTPSLAYSLKTIEFLYKTQSEVDIDMYTFDSTQEI